MADLIIYTDLQTYFSAGTGQAVTFSAAEQTLATNCCGAASTAIRRAANRLFEIQGSAGNRTFTYKRLYGPYGPYGLNQAYYGVIDWSVVYPSLLGPYAAPQLEVDDFYLTNQTIGQITVTDFITAATYTPLRGWPYNASADNRPFTRLEFAAGTSLPTGEGQLVVNAKWGWITAIPSTIINAALLQAARYYKRNAAPFGIAGDIAMGAGMRLLPQLDVDVEMMIADYRRWWAAA